MDKDQLKVLKAAEEYPVHVLRGLLFGKLAAIRDGLTGFAKTGYNNHHKYKFVEESEVLRVFREKFKEHRIVVFTSITDERQENGKNTRITFTNEYVDLDTGYGYIQYWAGEGNDTQDKGVPKAIATGMKYAYLKMFDVPTGDNMDVEYDNVEKPQFQINPELVKMHEGSNKAREDQFKYVQLAVADLAKYQSKKQATVMAETFAGDVNTPQDAVNLDDTKFQKLVYGPTKTAIKNLINMEG